MEKMISLEKKEIIANVFPEYQAIIDISKSNINNFDYEIVKYEALLRSKYNNKILYPNELLNNKKIDNNEFTKQMFIKVLKDIKNYKINVSFNINVSDIQNKELRHFIFSKINNKINKNSNKKIAEYLTFEFVEEEEISKSENKDIVKIFIDKIHELGGQIALDDFGKGYATIGPLIEFDFDIIKFDEILVKDFIKSPIKYYLLNTLIDMFNKLGKKMVAEYIEEIKEFNAAKFIGCDYGQGYCIAKPQKIENYLNNKINRECKDKRD